MKKKLKEGFSIVELLVCLALIGILSGALYTGYSAYIEQSKITVVKAELLEISEAFQVAMMEHEAEYGTDPEIVTTANFTSFMQLFDINNLDIEKTYNLLSDKPLADDALLSVEDDQLVLTHKGLTVRYDPLTCQFDQ